MNIKKNDTVIVLSGKDKGVKGKVLVAMPSENKVIVEKVNVATCHTKPRRQGEEGGIVKRETPIRTCKVALYCEKKGTQLVMRLGFSHEVIVDEIPGISIEVPTPNKIIIKGIDKQAVGQFAAEVRSKRPPEPYKGKGIKYTTEVIRRKVGKTGGKK